MVPVVWSAVMQAHLVLTLDWVPLGQHQLSQGPLGDPTKGYLGEEQEQ